MSRVEPAGSFAATLDGRRLHHHAAGDGEPTVVFESGMGASRSCWAAVQVAVADTTRTVTYDRAGLGRSDRATEPRTLARAAADLGALLDHLGSSRYVLVGHSWGGPIIRVVAATAPDRVAAMVLVDPTDENCDIYFSKAAMRQQRLTVALLPIAARLGVSRLVASRLARSLPADARDAMRRAFQAELASIDSDLRGLRSAPPPWPTVPVTVISGTKRTRIGAAIRGSLVATHRARAASLPYCRHVEATRSGHLIPFTQPDIVADEIVRLIQETRR